MISKCANEIQPTARLTHMPIRPCHPSAWHKVEAVCCAQVVQASRQQVTPKAPLQQLKKTRMAVSQSKSIEKINSGDLLCHTAIFADTRSIFFQPLPFPLLSCLVQLGRFDFIFFPAGLRTKLTSQLVLARSMAALVPCGGKAVAATAPLFVRALYRARLPRTPTRLARARLLTHV
ncbi:MAG: hypothetical protein ACKO96_31855 [Flammeovirgaceae bacterium]